MVHEPPGNRGMLLLSGDAVSKDNLSARRSSLGWTSSAAIMTKIVSFSLWGDKPIYNIGFIGNYELCKVVYPDWCVFIYYNNSIGNETLRFIRQKRIRAFNMTGSVIPGLFWRFLANDAPGAEHIIFRDCDSRVSLREADAVGEWLSSGKTLHVMRDHPYHETPFGCPGLGMLGGMWGVKGGAVKMAPMIYRFLRYNEPKWGSDQSFIYEIYERFGGDMLVHDEFFCGKAFRIKRTDRHFVGERIDEHENRVGDDYLLIPGD